MGRAEDLFKWLEEDREEAIDELIVTRKSEELFLDFKRSSDDGAGRRLIDNDRNNLAKAISGFGNSEGGVIIWGVDCSRDTTGADVARFKVPIANAARYTSWIEGAVSGCTVPPHQGVRSVAIPTVGSNDGFVVTLVPKSNHAPHQVVGRLQYFIRAGSDFTPIPHGVLAGMFGRVPQPHVFHRYMIDQATVENDAICCSVGILLTNDGPGIASDLFVNLLVLSHPGKNCEAHFQQTDQTNWTGAYSFGRHIYLISHQSFRLPPEAYAQPIIVQLKAAPPFTEPIHIEGIAGAGNSPPNRFKLYRSAEQLTDIYSEFMDKYRVGSVTNEDLKNLNVQIFALEETMNNGT